MPATAIPDAPGALPVAGHALALARDPLKFLCALPAHGDLVTIRIGPLRVIVVCDPALTRQLLLDDRTFEKGGPIFDRIREVVGDGLATCRHASHRRQRRLVQPALHRARMGDYAAQMTRQFAALAETWQDGQALDVVAEMMKGTTRTLAATIFAGRLPPGRVAALCADITTVMDAIPRRALLPPALTRIPTPGNRRFEQANSRLRTQVTAFITASRREPGPHGGLLDVLMHTPPGGDRPLTDSEITDQVVTFFLGGADTTANTLAWALHLLALHPEAERRLHAEVDQVLTGTPVTAAALSHLPGTAAVIHETLRLYSPAWLLTRIATVPAVLGGHPVSAGQVIAYSPYLLHHRPSLHSDPGQFCPDREDAPKGAYLPFGAGARKCAGEDFALTEAAIALATIAARWTFTHLPSSKVRPSPGLALTPKGLLMRPSRRF